jgi:hypothetical protein
LCREIATNETHLLKITNVPVFNWRLGIILLKRANPFLAALWKRFALVGDFTHQNHYVPRHINKGTLIIIIKDILQTLFFISAENYQKLDTASERLIAAHSKAFKYLTTPKYSVVHVEKCRYFPDG